jgi:hypothetical protein
MEASLVERLRDPRYSGDQAMRESAADKIVELYTKAAEYRTTIERLTAENEKLLSSDYGGKYGKADEERNRNHE